MMRIGEIILIDNDTITVECYSAEPITLGALLCTENETHYALITSLTSVCIEEGKTSQAFGDATSNDASTAKSFPHIRNSLRTLGKAFIWEQKNNFITLNQGLYTITFQSALLANKAYWQTLAKLSEENLQKHISWLQKTDPLFNLDEYIQKLSRYSRPLAWNAYLQQIEA